MAVNETLVEVVRFKASGLDEVAARTKAYGTEVKETASRSSALAGLLNDPRYQRHAKLIDQMGAAMQRLQLQERNRALAARVTDGSEARRIASTQRLNAEHAKLTRLAENRALAARIADGSEPRRIRDAQRLNDEHEQLQRKAESIAKYGERWGGVMHKYGATATRAGNIAAVGLGAASAAATGLARQGFQGTVEQAKLDQETKMIAREMAGIMKPVLELMTRAARVVRKYLEGLGEGGQNAVMAGTLGAGGLASAWALRSVVTGGIASRILGMGAGAGGAASAAGVGAAEAAGIGAGAAGTAGRAGGLGRFARVAGPVAAAAALTYGATQSDDYTRLRREGVSKVGSVFGSAIGGLTDLGHGIFGGRNTVNPLDEQRKKSDAEAAARGLGKEDISGRRSVMLTGGGFEESGSGYERIQNAIASTGGDFDTSAATAAAAPTAADVRAHTEALKTSTEAMVSLRGAILRGGMPRPGEG